MFDIPDVFSVEKGSVTAEALRSGFSDCADLVQRSLRCGDRGAEASAFWLDGLTDAVSVAEDVIRPLTALRCRSETALLQAGLSGGVYNAVVRLRRTYEEVAADLCAGWAAVLLPRLGLAMCFEVKSREGRGVEAPMIEKSVLGARDSFTEKLRTNTALVRRRLPRPGLKLWEADAPGELRTAVLYLEDVADPRRVEILKTRLRRAEGRSSGFPGTLERRLAASPRSLVPQVLHTERPDRFARGLEQGKIGVLCDGQPVGFLLPATIPEMLQTQEDRARHAPVAAALTLLRALALLLALLLPAAYVAAAMYHQEMIPGKLLISVIRAKEEVPFSTAAEVLGMLLSFELLQEAGIRLPDPVGQTVSVIGALIVGQSAVEARVLSPIVIIVVAIAGVGTYAQPSQELGAAVRLWRLGLVLCAAALGLFGVMAGLMALLWRLCETENLGVCCLQPLSGDDREAAACEDDLL